MWLGRRRAAVLLIEGTPPLRRSLRLVLDELERLQQAREVPATDPKRPESGRLL